MERTIAIVGSGPAGCYVAQALLKLGEGTSVDIFDRMPVPYGLLRYGVAADHQGTKAVSRQFAKLFERQGVRFFGNTPLAEDGARGISLKTLRVRYHAVVLAIGLAQDRRLGVPGEDWPGVIGAGRLTRHWNDHPVEAGAAPRLGRWVAVVGAGNVAIDVARLLVKQAHDLAGSDLALRHSDHIAAAGVERVHVIGRAPAHFAKFDPAKVKALARLAHVGFDVDGLMLSAGFEDDPRVAVLSALPKNPGASHRICFHFGLSPQHIEGGPDGVRAISLTGADGITTLTGADGITTLACQTVVTAIGFDEGSARARADLVARAVDPAAGVVEQGLYLAGWFKRGPRGTIAEAREDAMALARRILSDLAHPPAKPSSGAALAPCCEVVDYAGWQRIDAAERAGREPDRVRAKITDVGEMLSLAKGASELK